jgi:asparagine synthase (glutamine-hydrolysing)
MCGIVGFIDYSRQTNLDTLNTMRDVIDYRGPDSFGSEFINIPNCDIGLGHRRLSIQDLSAHAIQPMKYEHLTLIYNGEVYNFKEIREELKFLKYKFDSVSDTEVILKAFHAWGVKCVDKFRGMFAFSIFDSDEEKIYIFRDRAGVKPLYYYTNDNLFLFGSELKSFYEHSSFVKRLNKNAIPYFFRFGYIPAPLTIFEDTYKLEPGHYLVYDVENRDFTKHKYWDVKEYYHKEKLLLNEEETLEKLENILEESFTYRMVSDVPVGIFLSGGIDSSLVTALLQKKQSEPLKTFTIGFEDSNYDEAIYAKKIANHLKTEHTEYYCTQKDMLDVIKELPFMYDEPFGDSSAIPTFLVSKLAKEKVTVALSGDGGDEAFAGYSKYFALDKVAEIHNQKTTKKILTFFLDLVDESTVEKINGFLPKSKRQKNIRDKYRKFKNAIKSKNFQEMFLNASSYVQNETLKSILVNSEFELTLSSFDTQNSEFSSLAQMMCTDYKTFMVDDVLTKVDRASMSVSLEAREPLLDHKIIEFSAQIPDDLKYKNNIGKYLLRKILYKYVPKELIERPKSGFQIPLEEWLRSDLKYLVENYINKDTLDSSIFKVNEVLELKDDFLLRKSNEFSIVWFLIVYHMWKERYL